MVASSAAVGASGTVFIGSADYNLYALNGSTGALVWLYPANAPVLPLPPPAKLPPLSRYCAAATAATTALLLPHCTPQAALGLAETSRERVKALKVRDRRTQSVILTVTLSAGVAQLREGDDAQELIARADAALYAAKQAGRDRVNSS